MPRTTGGKKNTTSRSTTTKKQGLSQGTKVADLRTKPDNFLACYEFRHAYKLVGYFPWGRGGTCRVALCDRCGTLRETYFRANMTVMDYRYYYPDGYLKNGTGTVKAKDILKESISRHGMSESLDTALPAPKKSSRK